MKRNVIQKTIKLTACCFVGVLALSSNAIVANAAVTAGSTNFAATVVNEKSATGTSLGLAQYMKNTTMQLVEAQAAQVAENEVPVVKSEFADIGVSNIGEDSYINIRSAANTESEVVGKLYSKSAVTVLGVEGEWYHIHSGNCEGYIKGEYIITGDEELAKSISRRVAIVKTDVLNIRAGFSTDSEILGQVGQNDYLLVTEELDGWVKVSTDEGEGYVSAEFVTCETHYKVAESREEEEERLRREEAARAEAEEASRRQSSSNSSSSYNSSADTGKAHTYNPPSGGNGQAVADYACQFIGNPYVYGGSSLTNGTDCSGFVMSVYGDFGVGLPHSSRSLRGVGYGVSYSEAQPGDIICYSGHVGIYIGGNQIVHASNPSSGIKVSSATYTEILAVRRIF